MAGKAVVSEQTGQSHFTLFEKKKGREINKMA